METNNYVNSCVHRLPCGICTRTNQRCPLIGYTPTITWSDTNIPSVTIEDLRGIKPNKENCINSMINKLRMNSL